MNSAIGPVANGLSSFSLQRFAIAVVMLLCCTHTVFPQMQVEYFWDTAMSDKGYTSSGDMNRLNAIPVINELWLKNGWQRAFGMGLGNCDYASFDFLTTPFFKTYSDLHYTWISYAFLYMETGWIGLMFYYGFFALTFFEIRRIEKTVRRIIYCFGTRTFKKNSRISIARLVLF